MQRRLLPSGFIAAALAALVSLPVRGDDITPPPDPNKPATAPTATRGGSSCSSEENPLTAIAPSGTLITTTADYPALLFYIPETTAEQAQFVMANKDGDIVYDTKVALPNKPGIMRLNLSPEAGSPVTETGNPYRWELALICDEYDRSGDEFLGGELRRVEVSSDIENKLEAAENSDRFSVLQEAGLGADAIAALDELRRENPQDLEIQALWEKWLRENDLEQLVEMPSLGNR